MTPTRRIASGLFVSLPAALVGTWVLTNIGDGFYWPTYLIVATAFLVASFLFGFLLSPRPQGVKFREAWTRLFLGGALGWMSALATLGALNLTPLCVGQDNGDGINNLGRLPRSPNASTLRRLQDSTQVFRIAAAILCSGYPLSDAYRDWPRLKNDCETTCRSRTQAGAVTLFRRDVLLAEHLKTHARSRGLMVYAVDGSRPAEEMTTLIEEHFEPFLDSTWVRSGPIPART
jgi:hypothetical protein